MMLNERSEIKQELVGSAVCVNSHVRNNSSSRLQMLSSQMTQLCVPDKPSLPMTFTGAENEYGKYTHSFKLSEKNTCMIVSVFEKYPKAFWRPNDNGSSTTCVIYQDMETNEFGLVEMKSYHIQHQQFGFIYNRNNNGVNLVAGEIVPPNTRILKSPTLDKNDNWRYGVKANVLACSSRFGIEDAIAVSEDFCHRAALTEIETVVASFSADKAPLGLYANDSRYDIFPNIGDKIRDDGLLLALRDRIPRLGPAKLTPRALREYIPNFDNTIFAKANATILDIDIWSSFDPVLHREFGELDSQCQLYLNAKMIYERRIIAEYHKLLKQYGDNLKISYEFHRRVVECMTNDPDLVKSKIDRAYRKEKLAAWRIEFTYMRKVPLTCGNKISDINGSKGVISTVLPVSRMPYDKHGNVADVIMDSDSTINRMNMGRPQRQYLHASYEQKLRELKKLYETKGFEETWESLVNYYKMVSTPMYEAVVNNLLTREDQEYHLLREVFVDGIRVYMPTDTPEIGINNIYNVMEKEFPLDIDKISFVDENGETKQTLDSMLISPLYMIILNKTADHWNATNTPLKQHHGIIAKLTDNNKRNKPYRDSATRCFGEAEVRLFTSTMNPTTVGMMMKLANSSPMIKEASRTILTTDKPYDIDKLVEYDRYKSMPSRAIEFVTHNLECAGLEMTYSDDRMVD